MVGGLVLSQEVSVQIRVGVPISLHIDMNILSILKVADIILKNAVGEYDVNWNAIFASVKDITNVIQLKTIFAEFDKLPYTDVHSKREYASYIYPIMASIIEENQDSPDFETLKSELHKLYTVVNAAISEEQSISEMEEEKAHQKYEEKKERAREEYDPAKKKEQERRRKEFLEDLKETDPETYEAIMEQRRETAREYEKKKREEDPEARKKFHRERKKRQIQRMREEEPEKYQALLEREREYKRRSKERRKAKKLAEANEWYEGLSKEEQNHIKVIFDYLRSKEEKDESAEAV